MKLSISNIAWGTESDPSMYRYLQEQGFTGLEIAPTRIFPENPYDKTDEAGRFARMLKADYGLSISSMQSIWYGRNERIFGTEEERQVLLNYTKKAILFAEAVDCHNLVFGCPRNRQLEDESQLPLGISFFRELGDYAFEHHTVLSMEPNPPIYNTNYINTTLEAFQLVNDVNSKGFLLNLDLGTMIHNQESPELLVPMLPLINHIHISEPGLALIEKRRLHEELWAVLGNYYDNYISIEMGRREDIQEVKDTIQYLRGIFLL